MDKRGTREEIDDLVRATEKNREELNKSWKKVEDLQGAIDSATSNQERIKQFRKADLGYVPNASNR